MASRDDLLKYKELLGKSMVRIARLIDGMKEAKSTTLDEVLQYKEILGKSIIRIAGLIDEMRELHLSWVETTSELEEQKMINLELHNRILELENRLAESEKNRKNLHNIIQELKGNIRVFCRVRPPLSNDGARTDIKFISFPKSTEENGQCILLTQNGNEHSFVFDKVFMPDASQEDVFVEISQLVQSALDGYKVCIFAYGQIGSGKTYTMMGKLGGRPEHKGLIPRALEQIFEAMPILQAQRWKYDLEDVRYDANGNSYVPGLTVVDVHNTSQVLFLLGRASQRRSVNRTQMNEQSSRSHFVFTLRIRASNESTPEQVEGILNLIDLAGSERLSVESTSNLAKETMAINKSISALKDVVLALVNKEKFVPYKNSTLTRLLKPCLGGAAKTLMFVNLSSEPSSASESLNSLRFATKVNACEVGRPRRQT